MKFRAVLIFVVGGALLGAGLHALFEPQRPPPPEVQPSAATLEAAGRALEREVEAGRWRVVTSPDAGDCSSLEIGR